MKYSLIINALQLEVKLTISTHNPLIWLNFPNSGNLPAQPTKAYCKTNFFVSSLQ